MPNIKLPDGKEINFDKPVTFLSKFNEFPSGNFIIGIN